MKAKPLLRHRQRAPMELDLMPFIGLFALLICALLVSALWESLSSFDLSASPNPVLEILEVKSRRLRLTPLAIESLGRDHSILQTVNYSDFKKAIPELFGNNSGDPVLIFFQDEVEYQQVIRVLDALQRQGFVNVQLGDGLGDRR